MSNAKSEGGTEKPKYEILQMECFDMQRPAPALETPGTTFEPSYAGSSDDNTFGFESLFDYREGDREKAKRIIEEAQKKASLIESEAYEKGFAQGEKDGFEMGAKKFEKILDRIHGTLEDMVGYRQEFIKKYEKEMLHLICTIAEKVVRGVAKVDNRIVREAILEAFRLAGDRLEVTVRVNPEEVKYVKEIRPDFFDRIKELKSITIQSDPSISRGGCFMETAFGNVDARLESQLEKIADAVEQAFEVDD